MQDAPFKPRPAGAAVPVVEGRRIDSRSPQPVPGEFTYSVVAPMPRPRPAPRPNPPVVATGEKRARPRQRSRLRTGKVAAPDGRFMTECLVFDRSDTGSRLRLPPGVSLPPAIQFYDDQSAVLHQADVVWRMDREVGIRFRPTVSTPKTRALAAALRRRSTKSTMD